MLTNAFTRLFELRPYRGGTNIVIAMVIAGMAGCIMFLLPVIGQNLAAVLILFFTASLVATVVGGFRSSLWTIGLFIGLLLISIETKYLLLTDRQAEIWVVVTIVLSLITSFIISLIKNSYQISLSVLHNLSANVLILSPKGKIRDVNRSLLETFDVERRQVLGKSVLTGVPWRYSPNSKASVEEAIRQARRGVASRFDVKIIREYRSPIYLDFSLAPIFDRQHNVIYLVASSTDIGSRLAAENKANRINRFLQRQLNEIQALFDVIPIGIVIADDPKMKEVRVNRRFRQMFEAEKENSPFLSSMLTPKKNNRVFKDGVLLPPKNAPMSLSMREKKTQNEVELTLVKADGSELQFLEYASPILDSQGEVLGSVGAFVDITARKKVEADLVKSELRFRRLVDSNVIGVILVSMQGMILQANEAFLNMLGYSQTEVDSGNINWQTITPPEFKAVDEQALRQLRASGECKPYEKEYFRKDGTRLPILLGVAVVESSTELCIAFVLDISAQKKLERRKDEFIGLASHELKTPLTSIKVFAQLLERSLLQKNDMKNVEFIQKIDQQLDRLRSLVEDMLDVSKIEAGKLNFNYEPADFNRLLSDSLYEVQSISPNHIIKLEGSISQPLVMDSYRISQVMINLLTNAVKYSPTAEKIDVTVSEDERWVTVSVKDAGVGIPTSEQHRIFEKFVRARGKNRHSFPGLGLGLYVSKQIIDRHRGRIWVESHENQGSTFSFKLPKKGLI